MQSSSRDLILFEPNYRGHRMSFCALLIRDAQKRGVNVTLASSSETWLSDEYLLRFPGSQSFGRIDLGKLPNFGGLRYDRWILGWLKRIGEVNVRSRVVILEGDKIAPLLAISRIPKGTQLSLLTIRPPVKIGRTANAWKVFFPKFLGCLALRQRGVDIVGLAPATPKSDSYRIGCWRAAPDPIDVEHSDEAISAYQRLHSIDSSKLWFGIFGNVTRRKNLDMVLNALSMGPAHTVALLVGGLVSAEELRICEPAIDNFKRGGGTLILDNRLLTDSDLNAAIASVHVTVNAHSGDGPSQILGKSLALGTYIVAAGSPTLRKELVKLGTGTWSALDARSLNTALYSCEMKARSQEPLPFANGTEFVRVMLCPQ